MKKKTLHSTIISLPTFGRLNNNANNKRNKNSHSCLENHKYVTHIDEHKTKRANV